MIEVPPEVLARPEIRRALAIGDWPTVLQAVVLETRASQTDIAVAVGISQPHVSRLMSGHSREPGIRTVRALCDGLGIPRSLAGLLDVDQEDNTNRRQFVGGALGVSGLALIGTAEGDIPVDSADEERLLMVPSATYRRLEQRHSSRLLIAPVAAHLALIRRLTRRSGYSAAHTRRLLMLVSETAGLAAWLYVDLDDRASARQHYQIAVRVAERSGHPLLPAYMQASLGQFAAQCGDAPQAVRLIANARGRLPRSAPAIATIWLDAVEALALAEARNRNALAVLGRAEQRLSKATNDEPIWPWIFPFDERKLAGYRALAATKLNRTQMAESAFRLAGTAPQAPKQRAVMEVERARSLARAGQVEEACRVASTAFDTGRRYDSERVLRAVATFRSTLGVRAGQATAELDERLAGTYEEEQ
jgi:transcriptional regulator with XRE-family HTH domain